VTFEEFVKTRVFRLDLGDAIQDVALDGRSGCVYADKLWIETPILLDKEDPKHRVLLERDEFESTRLSDLEYKLYVYALNAGFIDLGAWDAHPEFLVQDWQYAVANDETRMGYHRWWKNEVALDG